MQDLQLAAGWYTDPTDAAFLRFWSGTAWSAHRKARPGLPTQVQEQRRRSFFTRTRRIA